MRFDSYCLGADSVCRPAGILGLVILLTVGTASAGREVLEEGIPHIKNPTVAPEGGEYLKLEEIWRAGGEDDEGSVFGVIVQAAADEEGNIYLLDMQLSQVQVFSPESAYLKTLSREGEGPGEVRRPGDGADDAFVHVSADRFIHIRGIVSGLRMMQGATVPEEEPGKAAPMEVIHNKRASQTFNPQPSH